MGTRTRAELVTSDRGRLAPYRRRARASQPSRSTVTEAIHNLVRSLPGSWEVVFPAGYRKATSSRTTSPWSGQRARVRRDRAQLYQRVFPLPDNLRLLVDAGERDALIARLHGFGAPEDWIARLTGASSDRIRTITGADIGRVRRLCASASSPAAGQDILRVGGLVVDRQRRIVTRGDQSVRLSARQCELLARLAARPGQVVGPAELAAPGSRSDGSAINLVRLRVCRLRRKLGPGVVEVVRGGGYKLASGPGSAGADPMALDLCDHVSRVRSPLNVVDLTFRSESARLVRNSANTRQIAPNLR